MTDTERAISQRRIRTLAAVGHGPLVLFALLSMYLFVELGGLACSTSVIAANFAFLATLVAAHVYWLSPVWAGVVWRRRHFLDVIDIVFAIGFMHQNGLGGYERKWGAIALPLASLAALTTIFVHRALRRVADG